jgi:hypothetical protein
MSAASAERTRAMQRQLHPRAAPGQALVLRVMLQPNGAQKNSAEWRAAEIVSEAAKQGVTMTLDSVGSMTRQKLTRKGLVVKRKGNGNSALCSLTAEVQLKRLLLRKHCIAARFPVFRFWSELPSCAMRR